MKVQALNFSNPGLLTTLDLLTMGDSSKRDDDTKIGKFDSGLKYAIAILYRHNIDFTIWSGQYKYCYTAKTIKDTTTSKHKHILMLNVYLNDKFISAHQTAFAVQLGHNWEVWHAFREIYSNCLDEGGDVKFLFTPPLNNYYLPNTTTIIINNSNNDSNTAINNWDNYFLNYDTPKILETNDLTIYENITGTLKLYKQGILIKSDNNIKALYLYDWKEAKLDEMRQLLNYSDYKDIIVNRILNNNNITFSTKFFSNNTIGTFEDSFWYYGSCSYTVMSVINELYSQNKLNISKDLKELISRDSRAKIGEFILEVAQKTNYQTVSVIPIIKESIIDTNKISIEDHIIELVSKLNLNITFEVKLAEISNVAIVADKYKNTLFVSKTFNKNNYWELARAVYMLIEDRNAIFKDIAKQTYNE